ncbi:putative bifunctional diguanylate cyclase/phosphodiesterase [Roseomonas marmotae]|uniref:EAL domain-containing protein n=1 Tax=Roseomonas marmotae TaxID=2768161 RepID=A0ABS3K8I1_9PROT|nr:EAL domain-containing protein [Roseomonas marmotae]MBO1073784.1 EAL domain-containing protein [Roseomonas marmotae]QTI78586.1 EAL domain-containing protein [Roseomonas marmotae]
MKNRPSFSTLANRARAALRTLSQPGRLSPEQGVALRREQAGLLFFLSLLFPVAGIINCVFISAHFRPLERPLILISAALVVLFYGAIFRSALRWKKDADDFGFLRRARGLFIGLGFSWGSVINLLAFYGEPNQMALILALACGVVSTPIISVPLSVAFGFFIPDAILSVIAVTFTMTQPDPVATIAFMSFTLYAAGGILCTNWTFNGRAEARAALQREITTVKVFLREYREGSPDWLWETDAKGYLRFVPANLASSTGLEERSLLGKRLPDLLRPESGGGRAEEHRLPDLADCFRRQLAFRDMVTTLAGGGQTRWFALTGHPVFDTKGRLTGFRGIGRDITERYEADRKLAFMANHDGLTGLLNRKAFVSLVEQACLEGRPFALASIDLDDFKGKNDSYGHHIGDALLISVAERIQAVIRSGDAAGRLGGDEFAVLLYDLDAEQGHDVATRLAKAISQPTRINDLTIVPGASLGVSASEGVGDDAPRMLMLTDLALYKAKEQGKGTACLFEPWMEQEYRKRLLQEVELSQAIKQGQITVAYQPIVDIMTGQVICAEALARWRHPIRGTIPPNIFVETAERCGLIDQLGELILRAACQDAVEWEAPIQVNVNLSPGQLDSGQLPAIVSRILGETGLEPGRLALEITETLLLNFSPSSLQQLQTLRANGIKLVLDDFGTGYSSLSYLLSIEVDGIKIDRSFTKRLPDPKVAAIYRTITRLAADLNAYVVAEGIEEPEQLEWLRRNGIHFGQGYLLGRPQESMPVRRAAYLT